MSVSGSMSLEEVRVKEEPEWENSAESWDVSEAAARAGLYTGHTVKRELVIGPEVLQRPQAPRRLNECSAVNVKVESCKEEGEASGPALRDCQVRLERLPTLEAWLSQRKPEHSNKGVHTKHTEQESYACAVSHTLSLKYQLTKHVVVHTPTSWDWEKTPVDIGQASEPGGKSSDQVPSSIAEELPVSTSQPDITNISSTTGCYQCDECGHSFRKKSVLKKHIHILISLGRCSASCEGDAFNIRKSKCSSELLVVDKKYAHGDKTYKCSECKYTTISDRRLLHHLDSHSVTQVHRCRHCDFTSRSRHSLRKHEMIHKPFQCSLCDYKCSYKSSLERHQRIHTGEKPYHCSQCEYTCSDKSSLQKHQRIHTGEKPYLCHLCNYACNRKALLQEHQRIHTGEKPFQCNHCEYKCRFKSNLLQHQMIHTGEKSYHCNQCEYKCSNKSSLQRHQRIHTKEKSFQCRMCEYKCNVKSALRVHRKQHSSEKTFQCNQCEYKCKWKSNLQKHQRIHTGEKRFKCNQCDYMFRWESNLKRHQRIHLIL